MIGFILFNLPVMEASTCCVLAPVYHDPVCMFKACYVDVSGRDKGVGSPAPAHATCRLVPCV